MTKTKNKKYLDTTSKQSVTDVLNRYKSVKQPPLDLFDGIPRNIYDEIVDANVGEKAQLLLFYAKKLPWNKLSKQTLDLKKVRRILNQSHYGLIEVKERILKYLAALKFANETKATPPILCLMGNSGIGKTSILLSLAKALNQPLVTISSSIASNSSSLMGNKTEIGAISKALIKAKIRNPILLFDEIDKLNLEHDESSYADLLNIFDQKLNSHFKDNFLQFEFDLSQALIVTTANHLEEIPVILRDRLEIIELPAYSFSEKFHIAKYFLLKNIYSAYKGLNKNVLEISDEVIELLIKKYTFESGVREINRLLTQIAEEYLKQVALNNYFMRVKITPTNLHKWLKILPLKIYEVDHSDLPGVVNTLVYSYKGGLINSIQVNLSLTNKLEVFSNNLALVKKLIPIVQLVYSHIVLNANEYNLKQIQWNQVGLSVYIKTSTDTTLNPKQAVINDERDYGLALFAAILSNFKQIKINEQLSINGSIDLKGNVYGSDYLKQKITAAVNCDFKSVILAKSNKNDLTLIPKMIYKDLKIHFVATCLDCYKLLFKQLFNDEQQNLEALKTKRLTLPANNFVREEDGFIITSVHD